MIKPKLVSDRATVLAQNVPVRTESYTPVSCQLIFDTVDKLSEEFKLLLTREEFLLSNRGQQQRLRFFFGTDEFTKELVVLNSYDKSLALRAASGTNVFICSNGVMIGDIKIYKRHVSTVDEQVEEFLRECFQEMQENLEYMQHTKLAYSSIEITKSFIGETLGKLFYELEYLGSSQLNIVKKQFEKPSYDYGVSPMSLWAFYQHVTYSLTYESANNYLEIRRGIQEYFANYAFNETEEAQYLISSGESFFDDYEVL